MRDTIRVTTTVLLTLSAIALVWQFWGIALLFIVSLAVAAMMRQPVEWLISRRMSRGLAIGIVLLIGLSAIAGVMLLITPILIERIPLLVNDFNAAYEAFKQQLRQGDAIQRALSARLPETAALLGIATGSDTEGVMQIAVGLTSSVLDIIVQSITVIFLASYWTMDRTYFERLWLSLLPPNQRMRMRKTWRAIEFDVGAYLRSEALQCIFGGGLLFAVFFFIGVKYPVTLACLVALLWLLPVIGPLVAVPATLIVGLISSPAIAILATVLMLLIYVGMQLYLEKRLYGNARFASTISLLLMLVLVDAMGIVGLVIAPVLASMVQIFLNNALIDSETPIDAPTMESLNAKLDGLRQAMAKSPTATSPATANLANRLEKLIRQIELLYR